MCPYGALYFLKVNHQKLQTEKKYDSRTILLYFIVC